MRVIDLLLMIDLGVVNGELRWTDEVFIQDLEHTFTIGESLEGARSVKYKDCAGDRPVDKRGLILCHYPKQGPLGRYVEGEWKTKWREDEDE